MSEPRIKVRANRTTGELELEGPAAAVAEWWDKLWSELREPARAATGGASQRQALLPAASVELPDVFGEFYTEFRSDVTDVDKVLIAGAFIQGKETDRTFNTKAANQLLLDQNIKVANASENVRRLTQTKRVFVVSDGKFRVSAAGLDHLKTLKANQ
ncbi:MAG: hypothetical protein U1A27_01630 [Phycisphaerae bacterium]